VDLGAFSISLTVKDIEASRAFYAALGFEPGIELVTPADESTTGPASLIIADPDGNPILFDQHR
jgi:catechol 2,3-dioxygenase-like lactoylglutathione lyase family enzyme